MHCRAAPSVVSPGVGVPELHHYYEPLLDWAYLAVALVVPFLLLGYFVRRRYRALFGPRRQYAVPWTGREVIAAFIATQILMVLFMGLIRDRGILNPINGFDGSEEPTTTGASLRAATQAAAAAAAEASGT